MENENMTAPPQMPVTRSLIGKLANVMAEISRVKKNGTNKFQNYAYATEADLVEEVRQKLGSRGVFVFTEIETVEQKETGRKTSGGAAILVTRVKARHTFRDSDSDESVSLCSYGEGEDSGDKGIYKALTGAVKYFISKNFLMSTGDDPENDEAEHKAERGRANSQNQNGKSRAQERPGFSTGVPFEQHQAEQNRPAEPKAGTTERSQTDLGSFEDRVKSCAIVKQGKSAHGPWTLYSIETEGHGAFSTYDANVYDDARTAVTTGDIVMVHTEPTPKGPKINGFSPVEVNAVA